MSSDPLKDFMGDMNRLMQEYDRESRAARAKAAAMGDEYSPVSEQAEEEILASLRTASFRLSYQALNAREIREELTEAVNLSNEDWAAWALMHLSPYTDAMTLVEANLSIVKHNVKAVLRMGK